MYMYFLLSSICFHCNSVRFVVFFFFYIYISVKQWFYNSITQLSGKQWFALSMGKIKYKKKKKKQKEDHI